MRSPMARPIARAVRGPGRMEARGHDASAASPDYTARRPREHPLMPLSEFELGVVHCRPCLNPPRAQLRSIA
jgi:hypothetical protein